MESIVTQVKVDLVAEDIARQLKQDRLFDFIAAIDDAVADYDFTKMLRDHFVEVIEKCDRDLQSMEEKA